MEFWICFIILYLFLPHYVHSGEINRMDANPSIQPSSRGTHRYSSSKEPNKSISPLLPTKVQEIEVGGAGITQIKAPNLIQAKPSDSQSQGSQKVTTLVPLKNKSKGNLSQSVSFSVSVGPDLKALPASPKSANVSAPPPKNVTLTKVTKVIPVYKPSNIPVMGYKQGQPWIIDPKSNTVHLIKPIPFIQQQQAQSQHLKLVKVIPNPKGMVYQYMPVPMFPSFQSFVFARPVIGHQVFPSHSPPPAVKHAQTSGPDLHLRPSASNARPWMTRVGNLMQKNLFGQMIQKVFRLQRRNLQTDSEDNGIHKNRNKYRTNKIITSGSSHSPIYSKPPSYGSRIPHFNDESSEVIRNDVPSGSSSESDEVTRRSPRVQVKVKTGKPLQIKRKTTRRPVHHDSEEEEEESTTKQYSRPNFFSYFRG